MAEPLPLRCRTCGAFRGTRVHRVIGHPHIYLPEGAVSFDANVHTPADKVDLGADGVCGACRTSRAKGAA
jgi:hypothetical protein